MPRLPYILPTRAMTMSFDICISFPYKRSPHAETIAQWCSYDTFGHVRIPKCDLEFWFKEAHRF